MPLLSSSIVKQELATVQEVEQALARQSAYGGDLLTNLLEVVPLREERIAAVLAETFGLEPAPVGELPRPSEHVRRLVPSEIAAALRVPAHRRAAGRPGARSQRAAPRRGRGDLAFALGVTIVQRVASLGAGAPGNRARLRCESRAAHRARARPSRGPSRSEPELPARGRGAHASARRPSRLPRKRLRRPPQPRSRPRRPPCRPPPPGRSLRPISPSLARAERAQPGRRPPARPVHGGHGRARSARVLDARRGAAKLLRFRGAVLRVRGALRRARRPRRRSRRARARRPPREGAVDWRPARPAERARAFPRRGRLRARTPRRRARRGARQGPRAPPGPAGADAADPGARAPGAHSLRRPRRERRRPWQPSAT